MMYLHARTAMTTISRNDSNIRVFDFFFFTFRTIIKQLLILCGII